MTRKMLAIIMLMILGLSLAFLVHKVSAGEEMVNGGFENDFDGWDGDYSEISTSEHHSGSKSCYQYYSQYVSQNFDPAIPTDEITSHEVWCKRGDDSGFAYWLLVEWTFDSTDGGAINAYYSITPEMVPKDDQWHLIDLFAPLLGVAEGRGLISISFQRGSGGFTDWWIDDVSVVTEAIVIEYQCHVVSEPEITASFTVDASPYSTPWTDNLAEGNHTFVCTMYSKQISSTSRYIFDHWEINGSGNYESLSIEVEITGDTDLTIVYVVSAIPQPFPFIYKSNTINGTWYMRSDTWTVHETLGYRLDTVNTNTPAFDSRIMTGNHTVSYGMRAWAIDYFGNLYELTSGSPSAVVTKSSEGAEMLTAYWNCPSYASMIDSVLVKVYQGFDSGAWSLRRTFITKTDLLIRLPQATWTFYYYVIREEGSTNSTFGHGSYTLYNSRINFQYYKASPWDIALARFNQQNYFAFMFTPWTYWLGDLFWTVLLFGGIVSMYMRFGSLKPILALLWILGGSGSILSALVPVVTLHVAWLMLAIAMTITLFKLIYGR